MSPENGKNLLVIGGGIAGCTVAAELAQYGLTVHLLERYPYIGGHAGELGCKAADACVKCNVCVAAETFRTVRRLRNVVIHTDAEISDVRRDTGNGALLVEYTASNGNSTALTGHGRSRPTAAAESDILACDAVVLATGFDPYDPRDNPSYGYGAVRNVLTGIEAEKQLAEQHRITRESDGRVPERIAFVLCVGSRTEEVHPRPEDTGYCSTVCCAYSLRIARLMKHQADESQITVFYMDIQNFGKDFEDFYRDCRDSMTFIRSRPYRIKQGTGDTVRITYARQGDTPGNGGVSEEEFDLAVLAVGMRPSTDGWQLAEKFGVPLDDNGFIGLKCADGLSDMQREGVYVAGAGESPKDIAGSIAQAKAVSAQILSNINIRID